MIARGFTLVEILVVLVVLGLVVGLVTPAVFRGVATDEAHDQVHELARRIAGERLAAVEALEERTLAVEFDRRAQTLRAQTLRAETLRVSTAGEHERIWTGWRTYMVDSEGEPLRASRAALSPSGLIGGGEIRFCVLPRPSASADAWSIEADPITGAIRVRRGDWADLQRGPAIGRRASPSTNRR